MNQSQQLANIIATTHLMEVDVGHVLESSWGEYSNQPPTTDEEAIAILNRLKAETYGIKTQYGLVVPWGEAETFSQVADRISLKANLIHILETNRVVLNSLELVPKELYLEVLNSLQTERLVREFWNLIISKTYGIHPEHPEADYPNGYPWSVAIDCGIVPA